MNETLKWLKVPQNRKKALLGLLALNLLACSVLLFITASGQGALYEAIKPSVVEERYILEKQYVGGILDGDEKHLNVLIFDVIDIETNQKHQIYFAKEYVKRSDLNDGDIIVCKWLVQVTGERHITSVINLDTYNNIYTGLYIFN